jgi:serine/threonine-protein kinase
VKIGDYEVEGEVGRGGMGVVYRARSPVGHPVAVKLVRDRDGRNAIARFERERRLAVELVEDDGFVPLVDWGATDEGPFIVMPLLAGGTLRERLGKPWPLEDALGFGRTLARALGRAHARGIVHRDLKPENIIFADATLARPLIADLGLAKHFRKDGSTSSVALTQTGHMIGTAGYMAPEQITAARTAGPTADVFALALILHECLSGTPAFSGKNPAALIANVVKCEHASLREKRPGLPEPVYQVLEAALAPEVKDRPPDGDAFARALGALLPGSAEEPASWGRTLLVVIAIAVVLALLAIMGSRGTPMSH